MSPWGDVDGDGRPDLFVTRLDAPDLLFRNRGDGTFEEVSARVGLAAFDLQSNGAALADLDNDGDLDLYVTVLGRHGDPVNGRNYLFMNEGGVFSEEAELRGAAVANPDDHRTYSVAVGDFDRDGWLDLHTNEWLPGVPANSRLLRNRGDDAPGFFEDVTTRAGVQLQSAFAFASSLTDLDRDGRPDLTVAADFGTSRLFWNEGDGFVDGTEAAGVGTDENGMGSTLGDFDNDGDLDWFVTSIWDPNQTCEVGGCNWGYSGNRLYRNDGDRVFTDVTDSAGVREGGWGWGAVFLDYDNDGDLDLAMTNGVDFPISDLESLFNDDPMRLWRNDGDGMTQVAGPAGLTDRGPGKGVASLDYDGDGDLDLFVVNNSGPSRLFRNDGGDTADWLRVELVGGDATNRQGLGAWIAAQPQPAGLRQVRAYGSMSHFLGQSESTAHFGLGAGENPVWRLGVEWADGRRDVFADVPRNGTLVVFENQGSLLSRRLSRGRHSGTGRRSGPRAGRSPRVEAP